MRSARLVLLLAFVALGCAAPPKPPAPPSPAWSFRHVETAVICLNSWEIAIEVRSDGAATYLAKPIIRSETDTTRPERHEFRYPDDELAAVSRALARVNWAEQPCREPEPVPIPTPTEVEDWRLDIVFTTSGGVFHDQQFTIDGELVEVWRPPRGGGTWAPGPDGEHVRTVVLDDGTLAQVATAPSPDCELDELADELTSRVWDLVEAERAREKVQAVRAGG